MNAPVGDLAHGKDLAFAELRAKREMDTSPEGEVTINLGISAAWVDLLGGRVDLIVDNISTAVPHMRVGNARILGLTSRDPTMGFDAPVIGSQLSGYVVNSWNCLGGPMNLPAPIVELVKTALRNPAMQVRYGELRMVPPSDTTPAYAARYTREQISQWQPVVRESAMGVD